MKRYLLYIASTIAIIFLYACNDSTLTEGTPFVMAQKSTIPGSSGRASAIAFAIGDKGYVALGRDASGAPQKDCWQYNPTNDSWTRKADFPGQSRVKAIAAVVDGTAYVGLGFLGGNGGYANEANYLTDFWMYDASTDQWTRKADFPNKYTCACACFVYNHTIYAGSGFNGTGSTSDFWKYSPADDKWTPVKEFPGEYREVAVAVAGTTHCFFGTGYQCKSYKDWWEYAPESDTWKKQTDMPDHGRQNCVAFAIGDRYLVATGRYWKGSTEPNKYMRGDILEYDPNADQWISRGDIPNGKRESAISFVINGKAYIGFGENDTGLVNDMWCVYP